MLEYEYLQCYLNLRKDRGDRTAFFAFADTVVAKAYNRNNECHGWFGIKYQADPKYDSAYVFCCCQYPFFALTSPTRFKLAVLCLQLAIIRFFFCCSSNSFHCEM